MNQYYRNDEMEILDPGMGQPRYPYAHEPNPELQSIHYKDWLAMCERNGNGLTRLRPGTLASTQDIITTSLDILSTILGFIPKVGAALSAGVSILSSIIGLLWPEPEEPGTPTNPNGTWIEFMEKVEVLIDEEISQEARNAALGRLTGLKRELNLYQDAFENWAEDRNDPREQEAVRNQFRIARSAMVGTIETMRYQGQEVNLLTVFAQAADLHLLLLREGIMYGAQWGMDASEIEDLYTSPSGEGLKDLLPNYTDHCTYWYNEGLKITFTLKPDLSNTERYPWAANKPSWNLRVLEELEGWNLFNDFRRDVTIMALDLVALWPTYDLDYYDNLKYGVKTELTRPVYSQAAGTSWGSILSRDRYEQGIVRSPHLVTLLQSIDFKLNPGPFTPSNSYQHYTGLQLKYYYSGRDYTIYASPLLGTTSSSGKTINVDGKSGSVIYQSDIKHNDAVYTMEFKKTNGSSDQVGYTYDPNYSTLSWPPETDVSNYGHQMSWISGPVELNTIPAFGVEWLHESCSPLNAIADDTVENPIITQIPAVKGASIAGNATVIKNPGHTGGDLVQLPANSGSQAQLFITVETPPSKLGKTYQIRVRYAASSAATLQVNQCFFSGGSCYNTASINVPATYSNNVLSYKAFQYADVFPITIQNIDFSLQFFNRSGGPIILDKIEFIPIEGSLEEYTAKQALENARKAVNTLFTNDAKNTLQLNITDYAVDQAANMVDCVSDEIYPQEKMILLDQVKFAKRLSQARNLLNYGDFESPDWSDKNGWRVSNNVMVQADYPISKGRYLNMPGARISEFSRKLYSTYAYQKVDESKLKPYTRYLVRGFVESSKKSDLFVTRYGKDIYTEMNVPSHQVIRNQVAKIPDSCGTGQVSGYAISPTMPSDPCQHVYAPNAYATNESSLMMPSTNGLCEDKQHFLFHIDVGELDTRANLGIEVGFKIYSPEGMAQLDNIEVIEANPLTGEALARVKKREQKWKREREHQCMETETAVRIATQALDSLFTSPQKDRLKATVTMQSIVNAERKVKAIPYVSNPYLEDLPGMNTLIFQQLQSVIRNAFDLYGRRNVIRNGDFSGGLSNWHATAGADVQERDGSPHVLVVSQWDANVSQDVCVQPERGYVLRVTARKEGTGNGYVTISDCTEENTETVTFTSNESVPIQRPPVTPPTSSVCDLSKYTDGYTANFGTASCSCGSHGTESCSCSGNYMRNGSSERYGTQSYTGTQRMPNRNPSPSFGYITKTIEMFPETNRIRIEIGETQGTFLVESIELICMED
ncbi:insecticidal delta-endotoxin Cry8Ea1 family protein [Bacillus mycoides]|uniref:insecticidal delta-endotoxin Cry8Ea1 family protein n=1 Tax=Bacillus mycoides TaxID=1405 RepID=UPI00273B43BA|nr:insecticidal delta-endotoxin Cry8Ea1 family protein [Bacillus mycoides]